MLFSDRFKIQRTKLDTWFNPVLSLDTRLFIDPFLIYAQEDGVFLGSHKEVIAVFNDIFKIIARSNGNSSSAFYRKAINALLLPEVEELCLGYTSDGTGGLGSGEELATTIAGAIWEAIKAGLQETGHFEEVAILRSGIGPDRISDATAGILRHRLVQYTEIVCRRHNIPTTTIRYRRGRYDLEQQVWVPIEASLPINPYSGKPILVVPEVYLRALPTINAVDFWNYCVIEHGETLRLEFNFDLSRRVSKEEIIELARNHPELRRQYIQDLESRAPSPYDTDVDPQGLVNWYPATRSFCHRNPISLAFLTQDDFLSSVEKMVRAFQHFVEQNAGWKLLWNDDETAKSEHAAQLLFLGIVKHYCEANDIDLSKEANIGRGPVDFKASHGYVLRALLELKLAKNTKFWNGLTKQLPTYQKAEGVKDGHFIVIVFNDNDIDRVKGIQAEVRELKKQCPYNIKVTVVDARREKPSASKL